MQRNQISRLIVRGFKSIAECDIELSALNILIGANGAGKSNFISFFDMIRQVVLDKIAERGEGSVGNFARYVGKYGGANSILYFGGTNTEEIYAELHFTGNYSYSVHFVPDTHDKFSLQQETFAGPSLDKLNLYLRSCQIYHFHDTGFNARIKKLQRIDDNGQLHSDGSNLAAFLLRLRRKFSDSYDQIIQTIKLVAPFFVDFHLEPYPDNPDLIILMWKHQYSKNDDYTFYAANFSDGTLRFACLATLLLQPTELQPEIILIDEPELGFHPLSIDILAELITAASVNKQIIVSTQSVQLLNHFKPENLIVVDRDKNQSKFRRLDSEAWKTWLEDYTLGELWEKNVFGGGPLK